MKTFQQISADDVNDVILIAVSRDKCRQLLHLLLSSTQSFSPQAPRPQAKCLPTLLKLLRVVSTADCVPPFPSHCQFFLDLIRHGKHHHAVRSDAAKNRDEQNTQLTQANPRALRQQEQAHTVTHAAQHNVRQDQQSRKSPPAREIVQSMVDEERERKLKMPTYKGLEKFRLLEKMGE